MLVPIRTENVLFFSRALLLTILIISKLVAIVVCVKLTSPMPHRKLLNGVLVHFVRVCLSFLLVNFLNWVNKNDLPK